MKVARLWKICFEACRMVDTLPSVVTLWHVVTPANPYGVLEGYGFLVRLLNERRVCRNDYDTPSLIYGLRKL